jgi:hypothetical protein
MRPVALDHVIKAEHWEGASSSSAEIDAILIGVLVHNDSARRNHGSRSSSSSASQQQEQQEGRM